MPQNWQLVDTNFPTFTGEESANTKIDLIIDYLRILIEELQYQLQNLDKSNWNTNAWNDLTSSTEAAVSEKVAALENSITALKIQMNSLAGRVSAAEKRTTDAETAISELEQQSTQHGEKLDTLDGFVADAQADIDELQQCLDGEGGIAERLAKTEEAAAVITKDADGNPVIGSEEAVIHLVGKIYINGVLYEGGVSDEVTES